ncbi:Cerato-platanin [Suillus clintonianus]|uniref:Cerato-platanin n=1 Tax=Suillus clintonianus TaxID=1904413 RepID=UPI001B871AE0|nr:Cerato-platanin [Suillus clintonianus]KAG2129130.1 Cerato-platanin [Suillus clintonianus]
MKFTLVVALLSVITPLAFAFPILGYVTYDFVYSNASASLATVSCSNGANGLLTRGYTTFGSIPSFPNIGAIPGATWNSDLCGTCWSVKYTAPDGVQTTIFITAIDAATTYNFSPRTFYELTGLGYGKVAAGVTRVPASNCGM